MKNNIILILFFLFFSNILSAQNFFSDNFYFQSTINKGLIIPEYKFFNYYVEENLTAAEFSIFKKTSGKSVWHKVYNYPEIGIRYYFSNLGNNKIFGNVNSTFLFVNFNIYENNKISYNFSPGLGLCYVNKIFDIHNNYRNIAIASHLNIFFNFDINLRFRINKKLFITSNINFKHISNASVKQPNVGLNFINAGLGVILKIGEKPEIKDFNIPDFVKKAEKSVILSTGLKSSNIYDGYNYVISTLSLNYTKYLFYKYAVGVGIDVFYDSSLKNAFEKIDKIEFKNKYYFNSGISVSNELVYNKLNVGIQVGNFVFLEDMYSNRLIYTKLVTRYKLTNHLVFSMALKTYFFVADYLGFGLGYYF